MESAGPFTHELWTKNLAVFQQIIDCDYIQKLTGGTLPREWFARYLSQDALYLIDDSRALAVTAARSENPDEMYFFLKMAKDGLDIERSLQSDFMQMFNITRAKEKTPAFRAYAGFLIHSAFNSPYPVAAAALLPCFWVYYKTGEYVYSNSAENNPYRKWIDTYSSKEYRLYTENFVRIVESLGQKADPVTREQMADAFATATRFELRVFEEAATGG